MRLVVLDGVVAVTIRYLSPIRTDRRMQSGFYPVKQSHVTLPVPILLRKSHTMSSCIPGPDRKMSGLQI